MARSVDKRKFDWDFENGAAVGVFVVHEYGQRNHLGRSRCAVAIRRMTTRRGHRQSARCTGHGFDLPNPPGDLEALQLEQLLPLSFFSPVLNQVSTYFQGRLYG